MYQRVTWSKDGTPTVVVMSMLPNSATETHTFGCRNPTLVMPDGSTTDGVTWTFQVREVSVTGTSARIVSNTTLTLKEGESGDIDFFRRLDCDDSTSI